MHRSIVHDNAVQCNAVQSMSSQRQYNAVEWSGMNTAVKRSWRVMLEVAASVIEGARKKRTDITFHSGEGYELTQPQALPEKASRRSIGSHA